MRTAVVEVGTAALRAVVVEPTAGGWFRVHAEHRVVLGLLRAVRRDGGFGEGRLQLLEETARRLRAACFRDGVDVTSVRIASSLADAVDLGELERRTASAFGAAVELTDVADEGRALLDAVARRTAPSWPAVVIDLADDIRAVLVDEEGRHLQTVTLDRGIRDLLPTRAVDPYHPAVRGHLQAAVRELVSRLPSATEGATWPVVTGPAVDALARAITVRRWGTAGLDHDGTLLSRAALQAFELELTSSSATQRMLLPAVDPAEVDLAALGVVVVQGILDRTGADGVLVSRARVQDGLVLRTLDPPAGHTDSDRSVPSDRTAVRAAAIAERGPSDHAELTAMLAGQLHDGSVGDRGPQELQERRRLEDGARLHDLRPGPGYEVATDVETLLRTGLRGFAPADLVELATLVGATCAPRVPPNVVPTERLPARRREAIARASSLLRLACTLAHEQVAPLPASPSNPSVEAVT